VVNQIRLTRKQAGADGHIHWNMKALMNNAELVQTLQTQVYAEPALPPASPWLDRTPPTKPKLNAHVRSSSVALNWQAANNDKISLWLLQVKAAGKWSSEVLPGKTKSFTHRGVPDAIALTAVSRTGMTSPTTSLELAR
jgi:hypothetical protein